MSIKIYDLVFFPEKHQVSFKCKINSSLVNKVLSSTSELGSNISANVIDIVLKKLVDYALDELLKQHKVRFVGKPEVKYTDLSLDKQLTLDIAGTNYPRPEIEYIDLPQVSLENSELEQQQVTEFLNHFCKSPTDEVFGVLAIKSYISDLLELIIEELDTDSESVSFYSKKLVLGDAELPREIESELEGCTKGSTVNISIDFPSDYAQHQYRNKCIRFKVFVKSITINETLQVNDRLAERFGLSDLVALKDAVTRFLEVKHTGEYFKLIESQLLSYLVERNSFELPEALVLDELGRTSQSEVEDRQQVEKKIRERIIIERIAELEQIEVSDIERQTEVAYNAIQKGLRVPEAEQALQNSGQSELLNDQLLRRKVIEFLVERQSKH